MATVGQTLAAPEAGWKRYDDVDTNIAYVGGFWTTYSNTPNYNGSYHYTGAVGSVVNFNFTGSKLRLIGIRTSSCSASITVFVDGTQVATINQYESGVIHQCLDCDIQGLHSGEHDVTIANNATGLYTLDAIDIDETGEIKPYSSTTMPTVSAPTNLTATSGDATINLSWTAVTDATGYNVKRSTSVSGPYMNIATDVSSTSYVDTSVTNGTTYYYVVTTLNGTDESVNSNEASATPAAVVIPTPAGQAILRVTMIDSSEREYRLPIAEIDGFVNWYTRTIGTGISCCALNDIVDNSKEYLAFEKIISFKVILLVK